MSGDSFQAFLTKLEQDLDLQAELRSRFKNPELGISGKELVEFAAGKGYKFSVQELQGELTGEQLDAVSGGVYDPFMKITRPLNANFDKSLAFWKILQ